MNSLQSAEWSMCEAQSRFTLLKEKILFEQHHKKRFMPFAFNCIFKTGMEVGEGKNYPVHITGSFSLEEMTFSVMRRQYYC